MVSSAKGGDAQGGGTAGHCFVLRDLKVQWTFSNMSWLSNLKGALQGKFLVKFVSKNC